ESDGAHLLRRYADAFPEGYKEDFTPAVAAVDLGRLDAIQGDAGMDLSLHTLPDAAGDESRLKVYRIGEPLSLSKVLPMLSSMGVEVVDERPYELEGLGRRTFIYEFSLRHGAMPDAAREPVQEAIRAIWDGRN